MLDKSLISGEAKEWTIEQLLESSKKVRIKAIADAYGIKLSDKVAKPQMIEAVMPAVEVQSGVRLKRYSRDELKIIMDCLTEQEISEETAARVIQSAPFRDGVVFLVGIKNTLFSAVPHELAGKAMMRVVTEYRDDGANELEKCAAACASLYGRFTPSLFASAAGSAYGLSVTEQQAVLFLRDAQSDTFTYRDGQAVSSLHEPCDIREAALQVDYYLPSRKEADALALFGADTSDYYYRQITNFFYNSTGISYDGSRELMRDIALCCSVDGELPPLFEKIRKSGAVRSAERFNYLIGMIGELYNRSRKQSLKGHKPDEVDGVEPATIPVFQMPPVRHEPVRAEHKIGRNDPCPCGSGKKYKKCCGKKTD